VCGARSASEQRIGWLPSCCLAIEIAIGIETGARQGKIRLPVHSIHSDTGSIWRPDPDFDLDGIAPSGAHFIAQPTRDLRTRRPGCVA
jgi:hypothetical protein